MKKPIVRYVKNIELRNIWARSRLSRTERRRRTCLCERQRFEPGLYPILFIRTVSLTVIYLFRSIRFSNSQVWKMKWLYTFKLRRFTIIFCNRCVNRLKLENSDEIKKFYGESCKLINPGVIVSCKEGNWRAGPHPPWRVIWTPGGPRISTSFATGEVSSVSRLDEVSVGSVKVG